MYNSKTSKLELGDWVTYHNPADKIDRFGIIIQVYPKDNDNADIMWINFRDSPHLVRTLGNSFYHNNLYTIIKAKK